MVLSASLILTLAAVAVQAHPQNFDSSAIQSANCPDGWSANGMNGGSTLVYCCPGAGYYNDGEQGCVIGASTVLADNPSYTAIVSSLYAGEQGGSSAPNTADATPTEDASMVPGETGDASASTTEPSTSTDAFGGTASTTAESGSGGAGASATPSAESTSSQAGAQAMVTAAPLLGAAALALFAL